MNDNLLSSKDDVSINKKFSLKKENLIYSVNFIDGSPLLKNIEVPTKIRNKDVQKFYEIITKAIPDYDFAYMYKNLRTLKIYPIYIVSPKFKGRKVPAYYDCIKNIIRYTKNTKDEKLPHELLHMASTYKNDEEKSIFSGFSQSSKIGNNKMIGRALNEGYTQLLVNRYFNINSRTYLLETLVVTKIENIITKEKMEKMYFSADLKGLINELLKYNDEKSIITFICALDYLSNLYLETDIDQDFSLLKKVYNFVVDVLLEIKIKKIYETEKNLITAVKELREYAEDFQHKIVDKKTFKNVIILDNESLNIKIDNSIKKLKEFYLFNILKYKTYLK